MNSGWFTKRAKYWLVTVERYELKVNSKERDLRSESVLNEEGLSERERMYEHKLI